jgi:hypothetical protein
MYPFKLSLLLSSLLLSSLLLSSLLLFSPPSLDLLFDSAVEPPPDAMAAAAALTNVLWKLSV